MNLRAIGLDRRHKFRKAPDKFAFLQLERDDGGCVLDASEEGVHFETFAPVNQNGPVHLWFSFNLRDRIEAWGELVWTNADKNRGGVRFLQLSEPARARLREWLAESPDPRASIAEREPGNGLDRTAAKHEAAQQDAVAAFVSKARPRNSAYAKPGEAFDGDRSSASGFEEKAQEISVLVPLQKYLAAKRKHFVIGIMVGFFISAAVAMAAFRYAGYRQKTQADLKLAAEFRAAPGTAEIQAARGAAETPSNPATRDVFSTAGEQKTPPPGRALQDQTAAVGELRHSRALESPGSASPALPAFRPGFEEKSRKKARPQTPAQLWAAVEAGNSQAATELAELYINGEGVPHNCMQARVLLLAASEKRNAAAIKRLEELDKTGCPGE